MSYEKYCQLVDELCNTYQIGDPESMREMCTLMVEGINFSLAHTNTDDDNMIAFCDFGELPEDRRMEAMERILEANMAFFESGSPHYAINPETGRITVITHISLSDLTTDELLKVLRLYAEMAQQWRLTYYLTQEEAAAKPYATEPALVADLG